MGGVRSMMRNKWHLSHGLVGVVGPVSMLISYRRRRRDERRVGWLLRDGIICLGGRRRDNGAGGMLSRSRRTSGPRLC